MCTYVRVPVLRNGVGLVLCCLPSFELFFFLINLFIFSLSIFSTLGQRREGVYARSKGTMGVAQLPTPRSPWPKSLLLNYLFYFSHIYKGAFCSLLFCSLGCSSH